MIHSFSDVPLEGRVDEENIRLAGFDPDDEEHVVILLENDADLAGLTVLPTRTVSLVLNSQPLQYKAFRQVMQFLMHGDRFAELAIVHVQVGMRFLRECRSMRRWRHFERMFQQRRVIIQMQNNDMMSYSNIPEIERFRRYLLAGTDVYRHGQRIHDRPSASARKAALTLIVTFAENLR